VGHTISIFIASVYSAWDAVVQIRRGAINAPLAGNAELSSITEEAIIAQAIVGVMHDPVALLVTGVDGTGDAIIDLRRSPGLAV